MTERFKDVFVKLYRDVLDRGQDLEIKVGGSSMWPFIRDGETLVLHKTSIRDIARGDVIATYAGRRLLCHRVFRKNREAKRQIWYT